MGKMKRQDLKIKMNNLITTYVLFHRFNFYQKEIPLLICIIVRCVVYKSVLLYFYGFATTALRS